MTEEFLTPCQKRRKRREEKVIRLWLELRGLIESDGVPKTRIFEKIARDCEMSRQYVGELLAKRGYYTPKALCPKRK